MNKIVKQHGENSLLMFRLGTTIRMYPIMKFMEFLVMTFMSKILTIFPLIIHINNKELEDKNDRLFLSMLMMKMMLILKGLVMLSHDNAQITRRIRWKVEIFNIYPTGVGMSKLQGVWTSSQRLCVLRVNYA